MQAVSNAVNDSLPPASGNILTSTPNYSSTETQRALTYQSPNHVSVETVPVPEITQEDDIVLKVTGTTICGSDLHLYHGEIPTMKKGDVLGHEFMGIVDKVGPGVKKLSPGDRVVVSFQIACGNCKYCDQKLSSMCDRTNDSTLSAKLWGGGKGCFAQPAAFFGYSGVTGRVPGGQAEYVRVPFADVNCLKIPKELHDEQVLFLSDVLPTSYHSVEDTGVKEGDIVGVWGLGPIGQCAIRWALLKGAKKIIAIDAVKERLELALDADRSKVEVVNFKEIKDIPGKILEIEPEGLDCAIDAGTFHEPKTLLHKVEKTLMLETDVSETVNEMILSVRKFGRIGLIAAYSGYTNHFNIGAVMERGIRLIGNGQAPVHLYWETILQMIKDKKFDPTFLISHRVPLEDFAELYDKFDKREDGIQKVFVETKWSAPMMMGTPAVMRLKD